MMSKKQTKKPKYKAGDIIIVTVYHDNGAAPIQEAAQILSVAQDNSSNFGLKYRYRILWLDYTTVAGDGSDISSHEIQGFEDQSKLMPSLEALIKYGVKQ